MSSSRSGYQKDGDGEQSNNRGGHNGDLGLIDAGRGGYNRGAGDDDEEDVAQQIVTIAPPPSLH